MQALLFLTVATVGRQLSRLISFAVAPLPVLDFALQLTAIGAAFGSAVALRAKRRNADADTWSITTAWASLGFAVGLVIALASLVI